MSAREFLYRGKRFMIREDPGLFPEDMPELSYSVEEDGWWSANSTNDRLIHEIMMHGEEIGADAPAPKPEIDPLRAVFERGVADGWATRTADGFRSSLTQKEVAARAGHLLPGNADAEASRKALFRRLKKAQFKVEWLRRRNG